MAAKLTSKMLFPLKISVIEYFKWHFTHFLKDILYGMKGEESELANATFQNPRWWPFFQNGRQITSKMLFFSRKSVWLSILNGISLIFKKIYCILWKRRDQNCQMQHFKIQDGGCFSRWPPKWMTFLLIFLKDIVYCTEGEGSSLSRTTFQNPKWRPFFKIAAKLPSKYFFP